MRHAMLTLQTFVHGLNETRSEKLGLRNSSTTLGPHVCLPHPLEIDMLQRFYKRKAAPCSPEELKTLRAQAIQASEALDIAIVRVQSRRTQRRELDPKRGTADDKG